MYRDAVSLLQRFEVITLPISRNDKSTEATCKLQQGGCAYSIFARKKLLVFRAQAAKNDGKTRLFQSALFARRRNVAIKYFSPYKSIVNIL